MLQPFHWGEEQQRSFEIFKQRLLTLPILAHPNYKLPFEIHADASGYGIGAILVQHQDGRERVIAYVSHLLDSSDQNFSISEKECLALVWAADKFKIAHLISDSFQESIKHEIPPMSTSLQSVTIRHVNATLPRQRSTT